jgi:hypothetical protein
MSRVVCHHAPQLCSALLIAIGLTLSMGGLALILSHELLLGAIVVLAGNGFFLDGLFRDRR